MSGPLLWAASSRAWQPFSKETHRGSPLPGPQAAWDHTRCAEVWYFRSKWGRSALSCLSPKKEQTWAPKSCSALHVCTVCALVFSAWAAQIANWKHNERDQISASNSSFLLKLSITISSAFSFLSFPREKGANQVHPQCLSFVVYSLQKLICLSGFNGCTSVFVFLRCSIENEGAAKLDYMPISFASAPWCQIQTP